jgi:hypothetical protein
MKAEFSGLERPKLWVVIRKSGECTWAKASRWCDGLVYVQDCGPAAPEPGELELNT